MNNKITKQQVTASLEDNGFSCAELALQDGMSVVISQYGGRIFGPFLPTDLVPSGESICWINGVLAQPESFQEWLQSGDWNLGGDRIWIAPEMQYNVLDRTDFWNSYDLPTQVDPGRYQMDQPRAGHWKLTQDMALESRGPISGTKELALERLIRQVDNPLRNLGDYQSLMDGVLFAGYEQVLHLSEKSQDDLMAEVWSLIQLNPGGLLLIPASRRVEYSDYYEPIDESLQTIYPDHIRLRITGDRRYKIGYKAAHVFGRLGYYNHLDSGQTCLTVRSFFNNPSAEYVEEAADCPGIHGNSIHVYNDDGGFGGFGELECNGQTIGGKTGRSSSTDQVVLWFYVGATDKVKEITLNLLGVEI